MKITDKFFDAIKHNRALRFILLFGAISLFADMTYEGARSITGAYLALLGASATIVGIVAGFGEFIGYALRFVSGYLADKTQKYWPITLLGYFINLIAVPLLALTNNWMFAAGLIILERFGKAIRVPTRDAMLSYASQSIGMGLGFGIHEALDKLGAMLGPLVIAGILFLKGSYALGFACLGIPAFVSLLLLTFTRLLYPHPQHLSASLPDIEMQNIPTFFWIYLLGACFVSAGYADFALIAYHFQKQHIMNAVWIPIAYAFSMGASGIASPLLGHTYDRKGFIVLVIVTFISSFFAPLVFLGNANIAFIGVALWSIGMGTQQSLMRAIVGNWIAKQKRGSVYGLFNMAYGISWLLGSIVMGVLYDHSIVLLVVFSLALQFISVVIFFGVYQYLAQIRSN